MTGCGRRCNSPVGLVRSVPGGSRARGGGRASDLGGDDVMLLLADYDQRTLVSFDADDGRAFEIDGPGPGLAFRRETVLEDTLAGGQRRLWIPVKDSADRLGVLGVVDDGAVPATHWEALALSSASSSSPSPTMATTSPIVVVAWPSPWRPRCAGACCRRSTFTAPDVSIAGFLQPSHGIAGDAFDYAVNGRIASLAIFDAMGHGDEASRMANLAVGCFRNVRRGGADPVTSLIEIDRVISSQYGQFRFVTAQIATFDMDHGVMVIANAGHPPALHLRPGRPASLIEIAPALPAGLAPSRRPRRFNLRGDGVLFHTDGLAEARSPAGSSSATIGWRVDHRFLRRSDPSGRGRASLPARRRRPSRRSIERRRNPALAAVVRRGEDRYRRLIGITSSSAKRRHWCWDGRRSAVAGGADQPQSGAHTPHPLKGLAGPRPLVAARARYTCRGGHPFEAGPELN